MNARCRIKLIAKVNRKTVSQFLSTKSLVCLIIDKIWKTEPDHINAKKNTKNIFEKDSIKLLSRDRSPTLLKKIDSPKTMKNVKSAIKSKSFLLVNILLMYFFKTLSFCLRI